MSRDPLHHPIAICAVLLAVLACSKQTVNIPLAEDLDRLRTLGVALNPVVPEVVATGSTAKTAVMTVYAAVPSGQEVSLTGLDPTSSRKITAAEMTIAEPTYEEHASFRLVKFAITVPIPTQSSFAANAGGSNASGTTSATSNGNGTSALIDLALADTGSTSNASGSTGNASGSTSNTSGTAAAAALAAISGEISYKFSLTAGSRTETAEGSFLVAGTGSTELATTAPTLNLTAPTAGQKITANANDLTMEATMASQEGTTYAWYVDSGEVKNRRLPSTTWVPGKGASHTVVGTVRTNRTFGFAIQIIDVEE